MMRLLVCAAALVVTILAATPVFADPPPPVRFAPFNGVPPEQFYRSAVVRRAEQLTFDLTAAKGSLAALRIPPPIRDSLAAHIDQTAAATATLTATARKSPDRGQLYRALAVVEREFSGLNDLAARHATGGPAFSRVGYDVHELSAAVGEGDRNPARAKEAVVRLAAALDEQADELASTADHQLGGRFSRELDASIRTFARAARQLHRTLDQTGDVAKAGAAFPGVGRAWGDVVRRLDGVPNLPAGVREQVARVDGLYRRLGEQVVVIAPPPPNLPQPPPPVVRLTPPKTAVLAVAAGDGGGPRVRVYHTLAAPPTFDFFAYDPEFRGGVRVAVADLNGDGVVDVATVPGKGMPALVRVFDGRDMSLMAEFLGADPQWTGGVNIAAADVTRDGRALIAVAPDVGGGPRVGVFDLVRGREVVGFFAYPEQLRGGVRLAWADLNGDGNPDLVTAPGPCDFGPLVRVFNLADRRVLTEFMAFEPNWRGGVWVASDRGVHILCGLDAGGPPAVKAFKPGPQRPVVAAEWPAFPPQFRGGVRVTYADVDGDGAPDFICAPGGGLVGCPVRVFNGRTVREMIGVSAFEGFGGGAFIVLR